MNPLLSIYSRIIIANKLENKMLLNSFSISRLCVVYLTLISAMYDIAKARNGIVSNSDCSTCLMPCDVTKYGINSKSIIKIFSTNHENYRITTIIDGNQGYFETTVSLDTENQVYSARVNVEYWLFSTFCQILSRNPTVTKINGKTLHVKFGSFRRFNVHLQPTDKHNILGHLLIEKVVELDNELTDTKRELSDTKEKFSRELSINKEKFSNKERKDEMRHELKYAISNSRIYGNTLRCVGRTNRLKIPSGDKHCGILNGNWLHFDMKKEFTLNFIRFRLFDLDVRYYIYNLAVSRDNSDWKYLAVSRKGSSVQELKLTEPMNLRYIKMEGYSSKGRHLDIINVAVDWI